MFNLEQAISDWRQQMAAGGIKMPEALDELESHLRDDVDQQLRSGLNAEQVFRTSIRQIGHAEMLKTEFNKNNHTKIMKRIALISLGIIGILVGTGFVMPAVAQYRHEGAMTNEEVVLLLLGIVLTLGGGSSAIFGARKRAAQ
jgi:hypothetical protein